MHTPTEHPPVSLLEAIGTRSRFGHDGSPSLTSGPAPRLRLALVYLDRADAEEAALGYGMRVRVRPAHRDRPTHWNVECYGLRARALAAAAVNYLDESQRAALDVVLVEVDRRRDARRAARRA